MCWCTPNLRTPCCGKPECVPPKLGATGKFPDGKLAPGDEGEVQFAVGHDPDTGYVFIDFGKPVQWLSFPPDVAVNFAAMLLKHAGIKPQ